MASTPNTDKSIYNLPWLLNHLKDFVIIPLGTNQAHINVDKLVSLVDIPPPADDANSSLIWDEATKSWKDGSVLILGRQSIQGPQGGPGSAGIDGAPGTQGLQGDPGPAGVNGIDGAPGPQGDPGPAGVDGVSGTQGPPGLQGDPGPLCNLDDLLNVNAVNPSDGQALAWDNALQEWISKTIEASTSGLTQVLSFYSLNGLEAWSALGSGVNNTVYSLVAWDDGTGLALYAGGQFTLAGGVAANYIAKWDGTTWSALGTGMNNAVYRIVVHDDGTGSALYVLGTFTTAGGVTANRLAKWNGTVWSAVGGSGLDNAVYDILWWDDGTGLAMYVCGMFITAGGVTVNRIAKWNGTVWSALGTGIGTSVASCMCVWNNALYVSGQFTTPATRIAKWNGTVWSALGTGTNNGAASLVVYDDGTGSALYAAGNFVTAGGITVSCIAKWNGTVWSTVGSMDGGTGMWLLGGAIVTGLMVYDDGTGLAIWAVGNFVTVGGLPAGGFAKWNGSKWSVPDRGAYFNISGIGVWNGNIYIGGFHTIAKWNGPPKLNTITIEAGVIKSWIQS
jgi:hypothetical protein